ncbi:unnamed protein product, partial [Closterium sp. NIES-53]
CKDDVSHWDTQLPTLEFAYNNASHAATGKTPFFLCYGREPLTPQQPTTPAHVQAAHDFVTTMQQLWEKTQRRITTMQTSQKQYADRQRRDHSVAVGDQFQGRQLPPPPPVLIQDEPEYEVERVLTHRHRGGKTLEFLLRWKGYDPAVDSWVGNARRALKDYLVKQGVSHATQL